MAADQPIGDESMIARKRELRSFLFLVIVFWPGVAISLVGALGLGIWLFQMIAGPPGPPA